MLQGRRNQGVEAGGPNISGKGETKPIQSMVF